MACGMWADGPVFAATWAPTLDSDPTPGLLLFSGGGGSSKSGVANFLSAAAVRSPAVTGDPPALAVMGTCDTGAELCGALAVAALPGGGLLAAGAFSARWVRRPFTNYIFFTPRAACRPRPVYLPGAPLNHPHPHARCFAPARARSTRPSLAARNVR